MGDQDADRAGVRECARRAARSTLAPLRRIEVAGRLVGQHQARPMHQRPGDRHALQLAAGELARPAGGAVAEPDGVEQLLRRRLGRVALRALQPQRQRDVLAAR